MQICTTVSSYTFFFQDEDVFHPQYSPFWEIYSKTHGRQQADLFNLKNQQLQHGQFTMNGTHRPGEIHRTKVNRHSQCYLGSEPTGTVKDRWPTIRKIPQTDLKNHTNHKGMRKGTASTKSESVSSLEKETPTEDDILQMGMMSPCSIKKFMDKEAGKYLTDPSADIKRKKRNRKLLERVKLPDVVTRNKSTSAIFKDYHDFRSKYCREGKPSIQKENVFLEKNVYHVLPPISKP